MEGLIIVNSDGSFIVRTKTRSCKCDTMEKVSNCIYAHGIEHCSFIEHQYFPISDKDMQNTGEEKLNKPEDWVKGNITKDKTFDIVTNISHEDRLYMEKNPIIIKTFDDKLAELMAKYNDKK